MIKKLITRSFLVVLFSSSIGFSVAQTNAQNTDPSLQGQYKEILEKSNTLDDYKVVKTIKLSSFWKNASDTIRNERQQLLKAKSQLESQNEIIKELKHSLEVKDKSLTESQATIDEITFLGMSVSKSSYKTVMWSLLIGLAAALGILAYLSKGYKKEATYRSKLFQELSEEFQTHKVKAIEKEKKLARELQTQKNKLEESGIYI